MASRRSQVPAGARSRRDDPRPYQLTYDVLKRHIAERRLPDGLVLLETQIAEILKVSRAPVRRALEILHGEGLVSRFDGRGYLVGPKNQQEPLRMDLRGAGFAAPEGISESIGLFAWERIYREVETAVGRAIPFGAYRVVESAITGRFGVSRTVAREVLSRLRDRGLIRKNRWSTWIAGPLTAHTVDECFAIRTLLEPHALQDAAKVCTSAMLTAIRHRIEEATAGSPPRDEIDAIEADLHATLIGLSPNQRLLADISESQLPMVINQLFDEHFGQADHRMMLAEHRLIIDHLRLGHTASAAAALVAHLEAAKRRTKARLKVLAVIPSPDTDAFLERIH
jgi:DNA-binding GntR family transcriptional regulator